MDTVMSRNGCPSDVEQPPEQRDGTAVFCAVVEEYEHRPDQCTIYPRGASGIERMSTWISAGEGSYVALEDAR